MKSVWEKEVEMPSFGALEDDIEVEAAVIGGGLAGLLTAYKLMREGVGCVVIEAAGICSGQTKKQRQGSRKSCFEKSEEALSKGLSQ